MAKEGMGMQCPSCKALMIRAGMYDPDGLISLRGGLHVVGFEPLEPISFNIRSNQIETYDEWWVCINSACVDGRNNGR